MKLDLTEQETREIGELGNELNTEWTISKLEIHPGIIYVTYTIPLEKIRLEVWEIVPRWDVWLHSIQQRFGSSEITFKFQRR